MEFSRIGFRVAFCYLLISIVTVTSTLDLLPLVGDRITGLIDLFWTGQAQWLAQHAFHLQGIASLPHSTNSRDTALDWIRLGLFVAATLVLSAIWTLLDRKRPHYRTAAAWLRFILRLTLILLLFRYGLMKVFPLQMSPPSLAVLNEPVGNMSPMTLLWTLIGLHPAYEMLCGAIECAAGTLLFFRRTATLGALLTTFVMTNVLLYNLFFDVPVKLGAANLLLYALAVLAPDTRALYRFFWRHQPAALSEVWVPPCEKRVFRLGIRAVEFCFLALVLYRFIPGMSRAAAQSHASLQHPQALTGEWHLDSAIFTDKDQTQTRPVLTGEGLPMTDMFLEPDGRVTARSADGRLWRAQVNLDAESHAFLLGSGYFDGERFNANYSFEQPDPAHLVLTPVGKYLSTNGRLAFTRVPLPKTYPSLEQNFHWVNEWSLER